MTPEAPSRAVVPGILPTSNSPASKGVGGFSVAEAIRHLRTVADCHAWRARQGDLDSATLAALLARIEVLRKWEATCPPA